ncbi:MAG: hypothetical protein H6738_17555 [Alphaproteobacteria bacterium]|nr:hypothetical protein [Alphaproteobacteria bacterium]MCB9698591.1 hypothetical protein [Alphaproteobacteria bacterium]
MGELSKVGGQWFGRACLTQLLSVFLLAVITAVLCGLPVCAGLIDEDLIAPAFWCAFLSFPPILVVGSLVVGLMLRARNTRILDEAMAWLGPGRTWMLSGRQWSAERDGRQISARYHRGTFVLSVTADPSAAIQLGRNNALARWAGSAAGRQQRDLPDGVVAFAADGAALDAFLSVAGVQEAAATICAQDGRSLRSAALVPGQKVELSTRYLPLDRMARGEELLAALVLLADASEGRSGS